MRTIAVDVDGVIGNQVDGLIPRVKQDYGVELDYWDITEYNPKIGPVDFWHVITEAQKDPAYISEMSVFPHAVDVLARLDEQFEVGIVTARPAHLSELTEQWLEDNNIRPRFFHCGAEGKKHLLADKFDILIDDYPKNIQQYLDHQKEGVAILFNQPWNSRHEIESDRLIVANDWLDVLFKVGQLHGWHGHKRFAQATMAAALG